MRNDLKLETIQSRVKQQPQQSKNTRCGRSQSTSTTGQQMDMASKELTVTALGLIPSPQLSQALQMPASLPAGDLAVALEDELHLPQLPHKAVASQPAHPTLLTPDELLGAALDSGCYLTPLPASTPRGSPLLTRL